jgi:DNA repair exonuclease SbcCD ATPase subunit
MAKSGLILNRRETGNMTRDEILAYVAWLENRLETIYQRNDVANYADNLERDLKALTEHHENYIKNMDEFMNRSEAASRERVKKIDILEQTVAAQQAKIKRLERKPKRDTVAKSKVEPQSPQWTLVSRVAETHML